MSNNNNNTDTNTENTGNKPAGYINVAASLKGKFFCCNSKTTISLKDVDNKKLNCNDKKLDDKISDKITEIVKSPSDLSIELNDMVNELENEIK